MSGQFTDSCQAWGHVQDVAPSRESFPLASLWRVVFSLPSTVRTLRSDPLPD